MRVVTCHKVRGLPKEGGGVVIAHSVDEELVAPIFPGALR